jgi:tetratricopeptide (TPR) repeat protein
MMPNIRSPRGALYLVAALAILALSACQPVQPAPGSAPPAPVEAVPTEALAPELPDVELPPAPALSPEECRGLLSTVSDFVRADDYAAVVTLLDTVLDCGISDDLKASLLFLRAESNMKQGDWQTAIDDYRTSLALGLEAADAAGARNNICWFYALDGRAEAALPYCEQAVSAAPVASYLDSRGLTYALLGDFEAAITDFEAALAEWSESESPEIQAIYAERQEWVDTLRGGENPITPQVLAKLQAEDAPALRADLVSATGPEATAHLLRGRQHHMYRQFDQAQDEYSQAIELDPDYALAHFYRGLIHVWNGEWDEALADMQRVTLLDPDQPYAHHIAGLMYMRQDDYAGAVAAFSEAIDRLPDEASFYADRASAYFSLGDAEGALGDLDTVLRYEPDSPQMLFMRGAVHRILENRGEAIADLERALELGLPSNLAEQAEQVLRELREGFF